MKINVSSLVIIQLNMILIVLLNLNQGQKQDTQRDYMKVIKYFCQKPVDIIIVAMIHLT